MISHWIVVPVLLPALAAPFILLIARGDPAVRRTVNLGATAVTLLVSFMLLAQVADGSYQVYALGNWAAPFGIVLVLDRLSAMLVVLTSILSLCALVYAIHGWDTRGRNFHALFQFQLMGLNGAFLTGDLFNLFVFFEILLIASYGLMLHSGGKERVRAGLHYVVINLSGSTLFLVGVGILYGLTGTLNMADLAVRVPQLPAADAGLLRAAALVLLVVFAVKAALLPLHFWLPATYSNAPAPVVALFAIMTKVGAYAIIRVYTLIFGADAGDLAFVVTPWLVPAALATLVVGMIGAVAARTLRGLASFLVIASMGTLLVPVGLFTQDALSAALYYLLHSTVIGAALFLLAELIGNQRGPAGDDLAPATPIRQPVLLGTLFFTAAIAAAGMPPLSGFFGKLLILESTGASPMVGWIWASVLGTSLLGLIALSRAGSLVFWKTSGNVVPEAAPVPPGAQAALVLLIGATAVLTLFAGPVTSFMDATAAQLMAPGGYIEAVLGPEAPGDKGLESLDGRPPLIDGLLGSPVLQGVGADGAAIEEGAQ